MNDFILIYSVSITRSPTSLVEYPILPAAIDLSLLPVTNETLLSIAAAASASPRKSSIMATDEIAASGLITPMPVYFGAEPPIGSNMLTPVGLMLPPAAMPMPP